MAKIKLVATDIDGTLIQDSTNRVYPEMFEMVKLLKEKDIIFAAASGRQYESLYNVFEPVARDVIFVAENGAHVRCRDTDISSVPMDRADVEELIADMRAIPDTEIMASTTRGCYVESKNQEYLDLLEQGYRNKVIRVYDILKEDITIIKLALYKKGSVREAGEGILIPKWHSRCHASMAGEDWVDFIDFKVGKGNALKEIQKFFHITPEETMVFGDNGNDITMFEIAGESYAVESAREEVKAKAKHICPPYWEKGVLQVLKDLVAQQ